MDSFNREISPEILLLSQDVLSTAEIAEADKLSEMLLENEDERKRAISNLRIIVGSSPKRPVSYLNYEIAGLPDHTRHIVRFAGDYIDQLVKYCAYEKGASFLFWKPGLHRSLGANLKNLNDVFAKDLLDQLTRFNDVIYVPAKHRWEVKGRPHLFSAKEAVYVCFMIKKLANQITPFSHSAQSYDANEIEAYHEDSSQTQEDSDRE